MDFAEVVVGTDRLDSPALAVGEGPVVVCWHGFPDHPAAVDRMPHADGITLAAGAGLAPGSATGILAAAGHFLHLDRPDEVARPVLEWFGHRVTSAWPRGRRRSAAR